MTRVLITGATGFVGRALASLLNRSPDYVVVTASRSTRHILEGVEHRAHDLLNPDRVPELSDIDVVIHTAARVHVMDDQSTDKLGAFRAANVVGTIALASAAAQAGVKRFICLSSIKVNGEETAPGTPFTARDLPNPQDAYGISKWEAEQALRELELKTGIEVVVVRPPLVYGPGVKANFAGMMRWLSRGVPLPLGAIKNQRSLVALGNLVDLLSVCVWHPAAKGQTFLVSDGADLSTTQLVQRMAKAMGCEARLLPVPGSVLRAAAFVMGKQAIAQRLCGFLQVDMDHTRSLLGWTPPLPIEEALKITADDFRAKK